MKWSRKIVRPDLTPEEEVELQSIYAEIKAKVHRLVDQDLIDALTKGIWGGLDTSVSTTSSQPKTTISAQDYNKLVSGLQNSPNVPQSYRNRYQPYYGISPTDKDARGVYEYQEPEVDEQGTYYGYKILKVIRSEYEIYVSSPRYTAFWVNGELEADQEPSEDSMFGIHCTKRPDNPCLDEYYESRYGDTFDRVLVKCALSGTIVVTEQGFRAQHAQIIGVYQDGYWRSYQDYSERASPHPRPNPYEREDETGWTYIGKPWTRGTWNSYYDPSAGS